jgi:hypothetical protein
MSITATKNRERRDYAMQNSKPIWRDEEIDSSETVEILEAIEQELLDYQAERYDAELEFYKWQMTADE